MVSNHDAPRLRCDPTEFAKKRQMAIERAKKIKNRRRDGTTDLDDCTFTPK